VRKVVVRCLLDEPVVGGVGHIGAADARRVLLTPRGPDEEQRHTAPPALHHQSRLGEHTKKLPFLKQSNKRRHETTSSTNDEKEAGGRGRGDERERENENVNVGVRK
jgi:hypothetical protein